MNTVVLSRWPMVAKSVTSQMPLIFARESSSPHSPDAVPLISPMNSWSSKMFHSVRSDRVNSLSSRYTWLHLTNTFSQCRGFSAGLPSSVTADTFTIHCCTSCLNSSATLSSLSLRPYCMAWPCISFTFFSASSHPMVRKLLFSHASLLSWKSCSPLHSPLRMSKSVLMSPSDVS